LGDSTAEASSSERAFAEGRKRNGWSYCAAENGTCTTPSLRLVRYGGSGAYFYKNVEGSISCTDAAFGGDPIDGARKRCEYANSTSATASTAPAVSASNAVLGWNASDTPSVVSYRVYYGTSPGTYSQAFGTGLQAGSATTYTVSNLASDRSYYFAVTAVDSSGNESEYSTEASLLIQ
jgi:hypothetical protein